MARIVIQGIEALKDKLNQITISLSGAHSVKVGFLENAKYPDGTQVALVAAVQEFGAPSRNVPSRPFFRGMVAEKKAEWPEAIAALLRNNNYDAKKTLELTGQAIAGQLKESINKFVGVPLAPATIKRKGFDKQLIDTGVLISAVDHEVE